MDRRKGNPKSDVERACNHYGITPEEYWANPGLYPLPERGSGLTRIEGQSSGTGWVIGGISILGLGILIAILASRKS